MMGQNSSFPPQFCARQELVSTIANPPLKTDSLFEGKLCGAPNREYWCLSCHRGTIYETEKGIIKNQREL